LVLSGAFAAVEPGWRTDSILARQGLVHDVLYYTDFLWDSGALRVSATDTDLLSVEEDEYDLMVEKGIEFAARALNNRERAKDAKVEYTEKKKAYLMQSPSRAMVVQTTYHRLENEELSIDLNDT